MSPTAPDPILVSAAADAWVWVPDDAERTETEDFLLVRYSDYVTHPLQLLQVGGRRPAAEVLDEVLDHVRTRGRGGERVCCWVRLGAPDDLEAALRRRGGVLDETLDVLARTIGPTDLPDLVESGSAAGAEVRWVDDVDRFRDAATVGAEAFGGRVPTEAELERDLAREVDPWRAGWGGTAVAYLDGRAVGTAGITLVGEVARLWGGAVLEAARGRGVYRALLDHRLRFGVDHGATIALVKGRVETSAPVLRRAGFEGFGQERSYLLAP